MLTARRHDAGGPGRGQASRLAGARIPFVLRSAADLQVLRAASFAVRRLPEAGLKVRIEGLGQSMTERLEQSIVRYRAACGCGEGAAAALLSFLIVLGWVAHAVTVRGPRWEDVATIAGGALIALVAAGLAKIAALEIERRRFRRVCRDVITALTPGGATCEEVAP